MAFFSKRFSLAALVFALLAVPAAHAQNILKNSEISLSGLYQTSQDTSGNGVTDDPTRSAGGQVAFRHSYHWWLGYEASYGYTRYAEVYSGAPYTIQHNMHEFAGSYLVTTPVAPLGFHPFVLAGASAVVMSPTLNGGQNVPYQGLPGVNFAVGFNKALLTQHLGLRVQYRGIYYKTPDFGVTAFKTDAFRLTSEPMAGLYLHF